jgi:hypothetical protein
VTGSTAAPTSEVPRGATAATEPQQVATTTTAVLTVATTAPSALLASTPTGGDQVAVVDVPDDDVSPPRWGQWENLPAPAPEPPVGVLVMREDDCVMSGCPTHGDEASLLRAALPASDGTAGTPGAGAGFSEAQAEQALWQGLRSRMAHLLGS